MHRVRKRTGQPRFTVGSRVRVRTGVMDPDFPGLHLENWTGTVSRVGKGRLTTYLIRWNPGTLKSVSPACQDRCEKEDIAFDRMWLLEEDLE